MLVLSEESGSTKNLETEQESGLRSTEELVLSEESGSTSEARRIWFEIY